MGRPHVARTLEGGANWLLVAVALDRGPLVALWEGWCPSLLADFPNALQTGFKPSSRWRPPGGPRPMGRHHGKRLGCLLLCADILAHTTENVVTVAVADFKFVRNASGQAHDPCIDVGPFCCG